MIRPYVVRSVGLFMSGWAAANGALMVLVPAVRFESPQWRFIESAPGGHVTMGAALVVVALVLAVSLVLYERRLAQWSCYGVGFMFISLATAQTAAALTSVSGGVMAGPTNFFIGMCFLLLAGVVLQQIREGP